MTTATSDRIVSVGTAPARHDSRRALTITFFGLWLLIAGVYVLSAPGRLDNIDAQFKYEPSASLALHGDILMRDEKLVGRIWLPFPEYPLGASIAGLPGAAIGLHSSRNPVELAQFLWSFTSSILGALIAPTLFVAWRRLGFSFRTSLSWSLVTAFATLIWPISASAFDQSQHAWFLLVSVLLTHVAVQRRSQWIAMAAGAVFSVVIHYQPVYAVLLLPIAAGAVVWDRSGTLLKRFEIARFLVVGALPGIAALAAFNFYRFDNPIVIGHVSAEAVTGNPLLGALVLLVSPGKGVLWYSPATLLAVFGVRAAWREQPRLTLILLGVASMQFLLVSSVSFPGGDWCWGPRYLVVTMTLLCFFLPYAGRYLPRRAIALVVACSLAVQLLGLSRDYNRFYYDHNVEGHFWVKEPYFHFHHSQLLARVEELTIDDAPHEFARFSSAPYPLMTYAAFVPNPFQVPDRTGWARQFAIFYWPRPWPLWLMHVAPEQRFIDVASGVCGLLVLSFCGGLLVWTQRPRHDR